MSNKLRVSSRLLIVLSAMALMVVGSTFTTSAQGGGDGKTVWNTPVFTDAQAERGASAYAANCSQCHAEDMRGGGRYAALVGDSWMSDFQTQSVADLFAFISTNMPNGANAGSLPRSTYLDLASFILQSNGMPSGAADLTPESGADVQILPEDGNLLPLADGTLVRVVGCLAENDNGWVVNSATQPRRIQRAGVGPGDATVELGDNSFDLLFVLLPLDDYLGHRVSVSGLSSGPDASEGINVSQVDTVADTCQ